MSFAKPNYLYFLRLRIRHAAKPVEFVENNVCNILYVQLQHVPWIQHRIAEPHLLWLILDRSDALRDDIMSMQSQKCRKVVFRLSK